MAARKKPLKQNNGRGTALPAVVNDRLDPIGDLLRRFSSEIVGADQQDDHLGVEIIDLSIVEPPENIFRSITRDAKIESVERSIMLLPNGRPCALPEIRDRVAV